MPPIPATLARFSTLLALCALVGCASTPEGNSRFAFEAEDYPRVFDAGRDVLRDLGFTLARIDAESGVLSTEPKCSMGLLEPWSPVQDRAADQWADAFNRHARTVRITFDGPDEEAAPTGGTVWVTLQREHRTGRRLHSAWVGASTFTIDPEVRDRTGTAYLVPLRRDARLEARIARAIEKRAGVGDPPPPTPADPPAAEGS